MSTARPAYGIVIAKEIMLPMRDGVRLATDIYRPARDGEALPGPFPTVLCRTPYHKGDRRYVEIAEFFTPHGFVTVLQDLRGRYGSEGTGQYYHTANPHEGRDGYDTIEWIAARLWSNGRVGMVGSSFAALVQPPAALLRPPHLSAIWPDVTPTNNYRDQAREGGAMQLHMFWALFVHAQDAQEIGDDPAAQAQVWDGLRTMRQWIGKTPWRPGETPLAVVPNLEQTLFDYYTRGAYDSWWAQPCNNFEPHYPEHADIPATFSGGWFDPYAVAMTRYYAAMARQNQRPQRLVMGPWTHVGMRGNASYAGDVDFGPDSVWGVQHYFAQQLRFFDRWLSDDDPPVRIFVMGGGDGHRTAEGKLFHGGRWRAEPEWPLARTQQISYYLHADGGLRREPPLSEQASLSYDFDPNHPVPTIGGSLCGVMELPPETDALDDMWRRFLSPVLRLRHIVTIGAAHQAERPDIFGAQPPYPLLADRPDVLVFQSEPLAADLEVTGSVTVKLWISSSASDTDFTAKLIDVYPPNADYPAGYHMNLVDSVIRTRFRAGWEHESLMEPGEVYAVQIELPPTSNLFQAGHRLRVDISSSNFPRLDLNPNTGEPLGRHTHTIVAHNTVHLDRRHPSQLLVPVVGSARS
ncbi:MAG TPA: CocE/NonD family hydrolase [Caldilineaceae bacterium]|nr:CocE/NonD family hydrolase [Caldilineaceae bacterium]